MVKMCRNTPTSTSVRFAADPHAAKQKISRTKGTANPGCTRRAFFSEDTAPAACGWTTDSPAIPTPHTVAPTAGGTATEPGASINCKLAHAPRCPCDRPAPGPGPDASPRAPPWENDA